MHLKLLLISLFIVFSNYCLTSAAPTSDETNLEKKNVEATKLNPVAEGAKSDTGTKGNILFFSKLYFFYFLCKVKTTELGHVHLQI